MAGKRSATSDLNHENWDRDEDPEESGTFQRASDDSLKRRIIKTAKRRNPISPVKDNGDKKSAFTSFSGFGKPDTPTSSAFSFLSNLTKSNGIDDKQNETKYYEKLKGLNQSVSIWIKNHVDANPLINLQPIFKDYEKYFDELEIEKNLKPVLDNNKTDSMSTFLFKSTTNVPDSTSEKTQKIGPDTDKKIENIIPKFSFGTSVTSTGNTPTPTFSFGNKAGSGSFSFGTTTKDVTNTTTTSSFTFGNNTSTVSSFTFGNIAKPDTDKEKEEEDEPPVNNFTPVIEKDHIYTIRCKVFIKKNDKFGDRGVGNLFLKPIKDSEKFQLIIRADTNLGNLLLNCILSENIPVKRLGNKDVMLVCVPTPESTPLGSPQPVPVLLRVKNPEEADALLEVLEKHKK